MLPVTSAELATCDRDMLLRVTRLDGARSRGVRVVKYQRHRGQAGRPELFCLITDLHDHQAYPAPGTELSHLVQKSQSDHGPLQSGSLRTDIS